MDDKLLHFLIDDMNAKIKLLREFGVEVVDNQDFNFAVQEVRYSPAQDKVIVRFDKAIKEDIPA